MSVKIDESGRRWIAVETEVLGTPEEVWEAIATGPGISSWFVPAKIDENTGDMVLNFGPGMDSDAKISSWDPPQRFAAESAGMGPDAPPMATEWTVEARSGGACLVRVVHSLFAGTDDWDGQLESIESGWPALFRLLHLYLRDFRGQPCSNLRAMGFTKASESEVWEKLAVALGLQGAGKAADTPQFSGDVLHLHGGSHAHAVLRLREPAPGMAFISTCPMGDMVMPGVSLYLFGEKGAVAAGQQADWEAWLNRLFPASSSANQR